jgi:hypothetical protein
MSTPTAPAKKEESTKTTMTPEVIKKGIESHKSAAMHHEEAAKNHHDAAKHYEAGDHEKAAVSTLKAHGHNAVANEHQKDAAKQHAMKK